MQQRQGKALLALAVAFHMFCYSEGWYKLRPMLFILAIFFNFPPLCCLLLFVVVTGFVVRWDEWVFDMKDMYDVDITSFALYSRHFGFLNKSPN